MSINTLHKGDDDDDNNNNNNYLLLIAKAQLSTIRKKSVTELKGENCRPFNPITPARLAFRRPWRQMSLRDDDDGNHNDREDVCYVVSNLIKQFNL